MKIDWRATNKLRAIQRGRRKYLESKMAIDVSRIGVGDEVTVRGVISKNTRPSEFSVKFSNGDIASVPVVDIATHRKFKEGDTVRIGGYSALHTVVTVVGDDVWVREINKQTGGAVWKAESLRHEDDAQ